MDEVVQFIKRQNRSFIKNGCITSTTYGQKSFSNDDEAFIGYIIPNMYWFCSIGYDTLYFSFLITSIIIRILRGLVMVVRTTIIGNSCSYLYTLLCFHPWYCNIITKGRNQSIELCLVLVCICNIKVGKDNNYTISFVNRLRYPCLS